MRRLALSFLFCALVVTAAAAEPERPIKPYPPVAITLAAPPDDNSFADAETFSSGYSSPADNH